MFKTCFHCKWIYERSYIWTAEKDMKTYFTQIQMTCITKVMGSNPVQAWTFLTEPSLKAVTHTNSYYNEYACLIWHVQRRKPKLRTSKESVVQNIYNLKPCSWYINKYVLCKSTNKYVNQSSMQLCPMSIYLPFSNWLKLQGTQYWSCKTQTKHIK